MRPFTARSDIRVPWVSFAAALAIIAVVYWPVHAANFVWDDNFYLHDRAWLRDGSNWQQVVFHGFPDWGVYFRPLGVALFTAELRLFNVAPAPMHLVSLALHLLNTLLVGMLARRLLDESDYAANSVPLVCTTMLCYGLHPALIEPVAWISSQFDLLVTLFTLLGIVANLCLAGVFRRSAAVASCFFLAACSKESAASFPLLLLIADYTRALRSQPAPTSSPSVLYRQLRLQWPVYLCIFVAGVAYLVIRHAGLGSLVGGNLYSPVPIAARLHLISATYLAYWKILIWPMTGLGPFHPWPGGQDNGIDPVSGLVTITAILLASASAWLLYKRKPLGALMSGFTAALLPVLHLLPIDFDDSYYHEHYATTAIAIACAFLPLVLAPLVLRLKNRLPAPVSLYFLVGGFAWLLLAVVNVRATLPLWSNEIRLWRWALAQYPDSTLARNFLLSTYIEQGDFAAGQPLADALMRDARDCTRCMLNVAFLALSQHDGQRASTALMDASQAMRSRPPQRALAMGYILAIGNLRELEQRPADAEKAYQEALRLDPLSPEAYMNLALLQARQGEWDKAGKTEAQALSLSAPDERTRRHEEFERASHAAVSRTPAQSAH